MRTLRIVNVLDPRGTNLAGGQGQSPANRLVMPTRFNKIDQRVRFAVPPRESVLTARLQQARRVRPGFESYRRLHAFNPCYPDFQAGRQTAVNTRGYATAPSFHIVLFCPLQKHNNYILVSHPCSTATCAMVSTLRTASARSSFSLILQRPRPIPLTSTL